MVMNKNNDQMEFLQKFQLNYKWSNICTSIQLKNIFF